jgi:hypothetical protein
MSKVSESTINFTVFEGGTQYYGMAKAKLPSISNIMQEIEGAGIAGKYESSILGHINAMTLGLNFRNPTEDAITLMEPREHTIELRVPVQELNRVSGRKLVTAFKHVFILTPKTLDLGEVAPAAAGNPSGEYAVRYWAIFIDGKNVLEIDMLNFIYKVNGTNYLAEVRKALGV